MLRVNMKPDLKYFTGNKMVVHAELHIVNDFFLLVCFILFLVCILILSYMYYFFLNFQKILMSYLKSFHNTYRKMLHMLNVENMQLSLQIKFS